VASEQEIEQLALAADRLAGYVTAWSHHEPNVAANETLRDLVHDVDEALKPFPHS
jgi:hypothetical protein